MARAEKAPTERPLVRADKRQWRSCSGIGRRTVFVIFEVIFWSNPHDSDAAESRAHKNQDEAHDD